MNLTDMERSIEVTVLELYLSVDEPKCEAEHADLDNGPCSVAVVARKHFSCGGGGSFNICSRSYEWNLRQVTRGGWCECGVLASECWDVHPI